MYTFDEEVTENGDRSILTGFLSIFSNISLFDEQLILIFIFIALLSIGYYYVILPMNYVKDLTEMNSGRSKNNVIRRGFIGRKVGKLPPVYPNGWFLLVESKDLKAEQVKYVSALGQNFAVFRSKTGPSYVLDAYCPHLGANMAVGGTVVGNCLQCPFHKWKFNGEDGKCSEIPYSSKVPSFAKVRNWPSIEVNGQIFVWYHAEGNEPEWYPPEVPEITSGKIIYRGRNEFFVNTHIQVLPENGADIAHFEGIHTSSFLHGTHFGDVKSILSFLLSHKWTSEEWDSCKEPGKEHLSAFKLTHQLRVLGKFLLFESTFSITQIGPSIVEFRTNTKFGPIIFTQAVTPVEPLVQRVVHRLYCPPILFLIGTILLCAEVIMFQRDVTVWNHLKFQDKPMLVKDDGPIAKFRRWYSQFYTENSPLYGSQKESLDW